MLADPKEKKTLAKSIRTFLLSLSNSLNCANSGIGSFGCFTRIGEVSDNMYRFWATGGFKWQTTLFANCTLSYYSPVHFAISDSMCYYYYDVLVIVNSLSFFSSNYCFAIRLIAIFD
jgi:hypothetical protein